MAESSGYLALRWNNHNNIFAKILDNLRSAVSPVIISNEKSATIVKLKRLIFHYIGVSDGE